MKKITFILVATFLSLTLVACTKTEQKKTSQSNTNATSTSEKKKKITGPSFKTREEAEEYYHLIFSDKNLIAGKVDLYFEGMDWENVSVVEQGKNSISLKLGNGEDTMRWTGIIKFINHGEESEIQLHSNDEPKEERENNYPYSRVIIDNTSNEVLDNARVNYSSLFKK
ncbi:hypothetical protein SAMN02745116_02323 [Pilibacter termitis]|uniref:Lipoprotein n=1 Tax=Pilibacter termitis TaxID=263852 RepID=A0A1T4QUP8_9ENTE|nr:hypothetical protein [Pilibacter termitis]SKA07434.1 hypothetical protein SAMN02745116_02323 [Pilibacter termitis]